MIEAIVRRYAGVFLLFALILSACQKTPLPPTDVFTPTPTTQITTPQPTTTPTLAPSFTPFPTSTPTATPTVALPVLAGTPAPLPVEPITPQNVAQIQELAIWGKGSPRQVAFSPDGKLLAVGTTIGIWLYDAETLDEMRFIETPTWVSGMAFSADGSRLFAQTGAAIVWTWDTGTGECLNEWRLQNDTRGERSSRRSAAFSPGANLIAVSEEETIWIWDVGQAKRLHTLEGHTSRMRRLAFSPDAALLASSSLDRTVRVWDVQTGALVYDLGEFTAVAWGLVFSPDGRILATGTYDGLVQLWNARTGELLNSLEGHPYAVNAMAFSPDGKTLASSSEACTIKLWDVETASLVWTATDAASCVDMLAFAPDGKELVSLGRSGGVVRVWDVETGKPVDALADYGYVSAEAALPTNVIFVASNGEIQLWDVRTGRSERTVQESVGHAVLSADNKTLASCKELGVWVLDLVTETGTQIETNYPCWGVGLSPDGQLVAVAVHSRVSYVYDVQTGERLHIIVGGPNIIFTSDGQRLITGASGGASGGLISIWDVPKEKELAIIPLPGVLPSIASSGLAVSPDEKVAAVGTYEGLVLLVDLEGGKVIHRLEGLGGDVMGVAFSPDGAVVAACERAYVDLPNRARTAIKLWDVRTGELLNVPAMEGYIGETYRVFFTPDGTLLVSIGGDNATRLWGIPPSE